MADEETPSYIDYSGASTNSSSWTGTDVINYFKQQLVHFRRVSIDLSSIKDKKLAKSLAEFYDKDTLERMIDYWTKRNDGHFGLFYKHRHTIEGKVNKKYGWD